MYPGPRSFSSSLLVIVMYSYLQLMAPPWINIWIKDTSSQLECGLRSKVGRDATPDLCIAKNHPWVKLHMKSNANKKAVVQGIWSWKRKLRILSRGCSFQSCKLIHELIHDRSGRHWLTTLARVSSVVGLVSSALSWDEEITVWFEPWRYSVECIPFAAFFLIISRAKVRFATCSVSC